jgi:hypothetical protein
MSETKIGLSPEELELVQNAGWILTKNAVIEKTKQLFNSLQDKQEQYLTAQFTELKRVILDTSPKISKGENYRGLPYVVLDYPRLFDKENIIAVRCLFWWGHFISITLHLSGEFKHKFKVNDEVIKYVTEKNFYISAGEEWDHHFEENNYIPPEKFHGDKSSLVEKNYLKFAKKLDLLHWDMADDFLLQTFEEIIQLMRISYQDDRTDL